MKKSNGETLFRVGDHVATDYGQQTLKGIITEDRGPLGIGGRRIYQVLFPMDPDDPKITEIPGEEMRALSPEEIVKSLDNEKVIKYLVWGGLVSILRSVSYGEAKRGQVWLCQDQLGGITHTFAPERGVVGGQLVPLAKLDGGTILGVSRDTLTEYVKGFGLNDEEAERVISKMRIKP